MSMRLVPYYGGKYRMVTELSMLVPPCKRMYELFGGSGALTLNYDNGGMQLINEKDKDIYSLWEVVKDRELGRELRERLLGVEYSKERFMEAKGHEVDGFQGLDKVGKAVEMFVLLTQSFNSLMGGYSNKDAATYKEANATNMARVYRRMEGIEISNRDGIEMACGEAWEGSDFVFLDPPYRHKHRGKGADKAYRCELSDDEHEKLLLGVKDAGCKVMLCGYRDRNGDEELYDRILGESRVSEWKCYLLKNICKPNRGGERAKEYVWVNYELPKIAGIVINTKDVIICKEQALPKNGKGGTIQPHRGAA